MTAITVTLHPQIDEIPAQDWDACANPDGGIPQDPFTTHRFLSALERSGSVGDGTGWQPGYLAARQGDTLVACAPLYVKYHSQGEYIFDHAFADAYARAGGEYYPKLQIAVPFTPVTGRRLLCRPDHDTAHDTARAALVQAAQSIAENHGLSSLHITFCTIDEAQGDWAQDLGLMPRLTQQYHWENRDYADFDAFLADLSSRKRKTIRKERRTAQAFGGEIAMLTGDDIRPDHWDAFWAFYQDTGARKWGTPYLTRAFFDIAQDTMRDDIVLSLAFRAGRPIAGALNFRGRDALYGRYWGAIEDHSCLHFELCYYQAIDWAITHGLARVEAGAQGEHKLARGYLPHPTHSLHWMRDAGFGQAVATYLEQERAAMGEEIEVLTQYGPFKSS